MNMRLIPLVILGVMLLTVSSCVTKKKYLELDEAYKKCDQENVQLKKKNIELSALTEDLKAALALLKDQNERLVNDSMKNGVALRDLTEKYGRLSQSYDEVNQLLQQSSQHSTAELQKLLSELQRTQKDLMEKEDKLRKAESDLELKQSTLAEQQKRLMELQSILDRKDSVLQALKNKVLEALTGFVGQGLSVEMKNGKVYVRMDEKLLFATGSFDVAAKGAEALKNIARVLEANPDINITVEGHTDNVPYNPNSVPINDNWDLSVMRATAVVKILLKNSKLDPSRITASGRSQFQPVDGANTPEGRSKNRRTEIILTPKLDELLKILEGN